jgi:hypothetical protein
MKKRIIVTVLVVVIMVIGVGAGVYLVRQQQELREKAAPATTLSLVSTKPSSIVGETFTVMANIDTAENALVAVDLYINFDPSILAAVDASPGDFFVNPKTIGPNIDNSLGEVYYTLFIGTGLTPQQGTGTLARFTFEAKSAGNSTLSFSQNTVAGATGEKVNVLVATNPTTITVLTQAATITPTPIPTVTSEPSPTLTPSPTSTTVPDGTGGGGNGDGDGQLAVLLTITPTPIPTKTSTPTPTSTSTGGVSPTPTTAQLPDSGVGLPTILGLGLGALFLIGSMALLF